MKDALTLISPCRPADCGLRWRRHLSADRRRRHRRRPADSHRDPDLAAGYATQLHSHPYVELLTVLEGTGEAWLDGEDGVVVMEPGVTIAVPANRVHGFRTTGDRPLVTFGIHTSGKRIVNYVTPSTSRRLTLIVPSN